LERDDVHNYNIEDVGSFDEVGNNVKKRKAVTSESNTLHKPKRARRNGSQISYTIDLSRDYGKKERLLFIEVMASGEYPSTEPAIPMKDEDEWEDFDDEGDSPHANNIAIHDAEASMQSLAVTQRADGKDRFAASVDPDVLGKFLHSTGLEFDESDSIYFLMTFPFYEHEFDLVGFLLDSVFGDGNDDDEEE